MASVDTLRKHSILAVGYFLLIAFLGVLLRFFPIVDFSWNYRYMVHGHSHIALLGWIYTALTTLIYRLYLSRVAIGKKYRILFWCTQITILGMLVSFPFTGYALFSIIFSTLFLFASYVFMWLFLRYTTKEQKGRYSYKCIRISLWYMVLSSLGPWALGIIMNTVGNDSSLYRNAIYFYLHFQYNGWFILALFGIGLYLLEQEKVQFSKKGFQQFFWTMNTGVILTFGISVLWMKPSIFIYILSGIGALLQLFAFWILLKHLFLHKKKMQGLYPKLFYLLLKIGGVLFLLKLLFQFLGTFPYLAAVISSNIDWVIGYLHWIFLGVISVLLFAFLYYFKLLRLTKKHILFYLIGFVITEGLLFYKGLVVWLNMSLIDHYFWFLAIASCIFFLAIAGIFTKQLRNPA